MEMFYYFLISLISTVLFMPLVIKLASKWNILDKPDPRKVHKKPIPRLGGLAIALGVTSTYFIMSLWDKNITGITAGAVIIIGVGLLDDKFQISPKLKLFGQSLAAFMVIGSGLTIDTIFLPGYGYIDTGFLGIILTWFWIVGVSNAINLIDGLDGLAGGVSFIIIATIAIMAAISGKPLILILSLVMLGSILGFLFFNFHPAKIFMGDTGSLFIGYSISVLSLLGMFKSVTMFGFIFPVVLMGVPIMDTFLAIIRRLVNHKPISLPDKSHLHHCLLKKGMSHRQAVLFIYGISILFSVMAVLVSNVTMWISICILLMMLIGIVFFAELIGIVSDTKRPFIHSIQKLMKRFSVR